MKEKIYASLIIGVFIATAILIRPQIAKTQSGPNNQWTLEPTTTFPNGLMAAGDGFGINANLLGGYSQSNFQRKIVTKYAHVGGDATMVTTTASPSSPDDMPDSSVSFTSDEISGPTKLVINWSSMIYSSIAGANYGVDTYVVVDGTKMTQTHISQPASGTTWTQHSANVVANVEAGSHTIKIQWDVFTSGQTGYAAVRDLSVMAIPE